MSEQQPDTITCALCKHRFPAAGIWNHLDIVHGITDIEIAEWPDGSPVIVDATLEPGDFAEDAE